MRHVSESDQTSASIPGYDVPAVEAWIGDHTELSGPFSWTKLPGGHSNLTYLLETEDGTEAVVRRPPEGELLPKAHDMGREWKIISALHGRGVPVAVPYGFCEDPSVTGAHFYVMSKVPGKAMYTSDDVDEWLVIDARANVGPSFIDTLAALHSLDPTEIGLGDLGRHDGYVQRQLRTWYGSWTASAEVADYDDDRVHDLHARLSAAIPEAGPARVVHGDFGLHNVMLERDGTVAAVLDWEIATLGDPLADFAYSINAWDQPASPVPGTSGPPTTAEGISETAELIDRYAERTGADLSRLQFYRAFNSFKTACILHGVYARYRMGQKSTEGVDMDALFDRMRSAIAMCATAAEAEGI